MMNSITEDCFSEQADDGALFAPGTDLICFKAVSLLFLEELKENHENCRTWKAMAGP